MNIWKRITAKLLNKTNLPALPLSTGGDVSVQNAQSWNSETHPEGRGDSYLVDNIDYDGTTKKMVVKYRDGFTAEYDDIKSKDARDFAQSDSKGRWALKHLWKLPYKEVK